MSKHGEFVAANLRPPTAEEEQVIREQEREDARQREAERHEKALQRAFMATPGATEADWTRERSAILARDRAERTVRERNAAQEQLTRTYRRSF